ncbi:MAG: DUF3656 domain-containing protein [Clostridiales bacterium]|jgi:putative protease|nr:DUF3656 domain-containing protein [Clostridiales bacterium]
MTEILAPAGCMEALQAAVANGADAVYLGGSNFSARSYAANFTEEELRRAVESAHLHQVRIYITLNTLISDQELPAALENLRFLANIGVDAVIVQDLGLLAVARRVLPDLPLHASTQMTVANSAAAAFWEQLGISRFILPRELSLANIEVMQRNCGGELEVFVHGALCIAYSGQCLMSSMIGARSGNRGRCAQPCRLAYALLEEEKGQAREIPLSGNHLLSPRDLYAYPKLEDYYKLDLAAWKIEGRMKKPEYVATVTKVYRQALDALSQGEEYFSPGNLSQLEQAFNRGKSSGYAFGNPGRQLMSWQRPNNRGLFLGRIVKAHGGKIEIRLERPLAVGDGLEVWLKVGGRQGFTVEKIWREGKPLEAARPGDIVTVDSPWGRAGDRVFKTYDRLLMEEARRSYGEPALIPLRIRIYARLGQPLSWEARDDLDNKVVYSSDYVVQKAKTSPSDWQSIEKQVARLGGSGFGLAQLDGELDEGVILPASVLNQGRRHLVELISRARRSPFAGYSVNRQDIEREIEDLRKPPTPGPVRSLRFTALVADAEAARLVAKLGIKQIYLTAESWQPRREAIKWKNLENEIAASGGRLIPALPRIWHEDKLEFWRNRLQLWQESGIETVLVADWGGLQLAGEQGLVIYGDSSLNAYNRQACLALAAAGVKQLHLSPEMNLEQFQALGGLPLATEWTVQGRQTLMTSEYCLLGAALGEREEEKPCRRPCRQGIYYSLKDEQNYVFPLRFDENCRMQVFNSRPLCLIADLPALARAGLSYARLDLRLAEANEIRNIVTLYQKVPAGEIAADSARRQLLPDGQFTKGHLYRGV